MENKILLFVGVLLGSIAVSESLTCYFCTWNTLAADNNCKTVLSGITTTITNVPSSTTACTYCKVTTVDTTFYDLVERTCATSCSAGSSRYNNMYDWTVTCCQTDSCNSATFTSASDGTTLKTTGFLLTLILLISGCILTDYLY